MLDSTFSKVILIVTLIFIIAIIIAFSDFSFNEMRKTTLHQLSVFINTFVKRQEEAYREKMTKQEMPKLLYNYNVLMSRLKLEIPLFATLPLTQFKWLIYLTGFLSSLLVTLLIFRNIILLPILFIIITVSIICGIFSFTIKNRLRRIIDCINAENILAANIDNGFLHSIHQNLKSLPNSVRKDYEQYTINIEVLNFSSREALQILDLDTGKFSTDFLSNINILENHKTEGFENTFKDTAELNNIKKLARNKMDNLIAKISKDFAIAFIISYGSLMLELLLCSFLANFYFHNTIGQVIFILDLAVAAYMYLRINMLKATEL